MIAGAGAGGAVRATGWRATAIRFQQFGDGARAVGAIDDDDVGFGERWRWWRRRVAQRGSASYRVIDSDRQILVCGVQQD
jgi:hypothetical protein